MAIINSWDEFSPLEELIVGSTYDASFFRDVKNERIRSVLSRVFDETCEDIENFIALMRSHGIKTYHASPKELGYEDSILAYTDVNGAIGYTGKGNDHLVKDSLIPTSPLQARDDMIAMGDRLLITDRTFEVMGYARKAVEWFGADNVDLRIFEGGQRFKRTEKNLDNWLIRRNYETTLTPQQREELLATNTLAGFCSPNLTRIGKTCFIDIWQTPDATAYLREHYPTFDYRELHIGGHNDSIFSVVRPGLVIATKWLKEYEHYFKDWEVLYFKDPNWKRIAAWGDLKHKNKGKWWVPGAEDNDEFTAFVGHWLDNWVGEVEETVFDVNVLVIDDKNVIVNSDSPALLSALTERGINPIVAPLRHRFFFDGGWHCLTLDVKRRGGQTDYGL